MTKPQSTSSKKSLTRKDYDIYNPETKTIQEKKRVETSGMAVSVNGVIENTSINPSRVLFLIGAQYGLYLLVSKLFEYFFFYLHYGKPLLSRKRQIQNGWNETLRPGFCRGPRKFRGIEHYLTYVLDSVLKLLKIILHHPLLV